MFSFIFGNKSSFKNNVIREQISQYIESNDVNFRQELLLSLKKNITAPEMSQFLVEDFVSVTFNLQLPSIFNTFDSETNSKFETTLREKIAAMYSEHMHEYRKLFKISPFKAECLKLNCV